MFGLLGTSKKRKKTKRKGLVIKMSLCIIMQTHDLIILGADIA